MASYVRELPNTLGSVLPNVLADSPSYHTAVELLRFRATHQPAQTAYRFLKDGETEVASLTYAELDRRARAYGAYLRGLGLAGKPVLLLFPAGLEFIEAFFGCLYAGAIAVPAYPPRNQRGLPRIRAILEDSGARAVLTPGQSLSKVLLLLEGNTGCPGMQYLTPEGAADTLAEQWELPPLAADSLALLQYTSGSTAAPKGVMVTHGNILSNEEMIRRAFQHTENDSFVGWLPLFHDMGLLANIVEPVYVGIPSILMSPAAFLQKPIRWLQAIANYQATTSGGPNFAYELCLRKIKSEERAELNLSNWRIAFTGAEPVRARTLEEFADAFAGCGFRADAFLPCYGLAEATLMVSGGPADVRPAMPTLDGLSLEKHRVLEVETGTPGARRLVACGHNRPGKITGQNLVIVNPATQVRCAPDEIGEIWVAGPHVTQGYWQRPEETRATFQACLCNGEGPFLRTGDLGFLQDGNLVITGRLKDLIILNGRNVYPQDLEWTAERSHAALRPGCSAAFAIEANGHEQPVVVCELGPREAPDLEEVLGCIRQGVATAHEVAVQHVVLVKFGTIPKTSSGKIQRQTTRAQYLAGEFKVLGAWHWSAPVSEPSADAVTAVEAPKAPSQDKQQSPATAATIRKWLVDELARELRVPPSEIDVSQPFYFYGLASVEGVALAAKLEAWLGKSVPMSLVWDYPTVEAVADHLSLQAQANNQTACAAVHRTRD